MRWLSLLAALALAAFSLAMPAQAQVVVGSKKFTESVILGEVAREALGQQGVSAEHRRELGGSRILWDALLAGEIDVYPEYTGTLRFELLHDARLASDAELPAALARHGIVMSRPIGFSNGYALAMRRDVARHLGIRTISDLARRPHANIALSNEFIDRGDGWPALSRAYGLTNLDARGIDHDLAYRALAAGQIDVTDAYTTDAEIAAYDLVLLDDDRRFFPSYDAVFLSREGTSPTALAALNRIGGTIDEARMQALNRAVRLNGATEEATARQFIGGVSSSDPGAAPWKAIAEHTLEHLWLVAVSLAAAIAIALPLGVVAARNRRLGGLLLSLTAVLQTIPSLALFVMLIPLLGIGAAPTIAALFLYSLLPIVRNTHAGLTGIAPALLDSATALGLSAGARLRRIELPLALPTIMAGIRTAAVIAVGLATLGAIIGAGGYGQPILTGIRLANTETILSGAIPAAVMALVIDGLFHLIQRAVTPRGLRIVRVRR